MTGGRAGLVACVVLAALTAVPGRAAARVLLRSGDAASDGERLASFDRPVPGPSDTIAFVGSTGALMVAEAGGLSVVARTGDALPAPLTGTFNAFGAAAINDAGGVAFRAGLNSTLADDGIFLYRDGSIVPIVLAGGAAGDPGGVGDPVLNNAFDVAYGTAERIQLWGAATRAVVQLVARGGAVPGGGTFRRFGRSIALNDQGVVAFFADERRSGDGVFTVSAAAGLRRIASFRARPTRVAIAINAKGQVAFTQGAGRRGTARSIGLYDPVTSAVSTLTVGAPPGELLLGVGPASLDVDAEGRVAFEGYFKRPGPDLFRPVLVTPGGLVVLSESGARRAGTFVVDTSSAGLVVWADQGEIFRYDGASVRVVGRRDPTPIGPAVVAGRPAVNDRGAIVFRAIREALYVHAAGGVRAALRAGDEIAGATVTSFGAHAFAGGRLACFARLADGRRALLVGEPGALRPFVVDGAPAVGGGTLTLDADVVGLDGARLLFAATVTGGDGATRNTLFRADLRRNVLRRLELPGGRVMREASFVPFVPISVSRPQVLLEGASRRADELLLLAGQRKAARVAVAGRRARGTGGRFASFGEAAAVQRNVLFSASVAGGATAGGVFLWSPGGVKPVLVGGEPAPGGGTVGTVDLGAPLALDAEHAAFILPVLQDDGVERNALFAVTGGVPRVLVREGDPTPEGGALLAFGGRASLAIAGDTVVYVGALTGAGAAAGLFACSDLACQ